jgi:1-hydroxycarotenoid 3,4-desaturase
MTLKHPVIVIGAGMGGLAAALSLASQQVPVTLIERHASPGGKMRQLRVAGRLIDAGPTVFTMRWVFESMFKQAGLRLEDYLQLHRAHLLARHSWLDGTALDLYPQLEPSMQAISEFASDRDADNYRRFASQTEKIFDTLDKTFMQAQRPNPIALSVAGGLRGMMDMANTKPFVSLWKSLSGTFEDPRLRQLFARYATYCGSSPFKAPATLMLIAHVERAGVWLVEGGMQALANAMAQALAELGVELRFGDGVTAIDTQGGRVSGVSLESGIRLPADAVVFNGDTQALAKGLLGESVRHACSQRKEASLSAVTHCQVARTAGFELAHHTVFFGDDYEDEFTSVFKRQTITQRPTVYVCAQDRGNELQQASGGERERLFSLVNAPACELAKPAIDQALEKLHNTLQQHGLVISDAQSEGIVTTPNDFADLIPASDGALYGRPTHGWMGSFKRPGSLSRIPNLYLCGGSVHPGAGVPMAALSGQLAAAKLCRETSAT